MKRIIALLIAVWMLALGACALAAVPAKPAAFAYAFDYTAGTLSENDKQTISQYGQALEEATGIQAIAVVVDFLDGIEPEDYVTDLINSWGVGSAKENDGVVLLRSLGEPCVQIGTGRGLDRVMTGAKCGEIIDRSASYFINKQHAKGIVQVYKDMCQYLASAKGKKLSVSGQTLANVSYDDYEDDGVDLFDMVLLLFGFYLVFCVFFNAFSRRTGGGGCLRFLFMSWLFDRRRPPRGPRPPRMGGPRGPGPRGRFRGSFNDEPRDDSHGGFGGFGGFGGGFGGGSHGGFGGGSHGGFGGGSHGGFGGGNSRGGGGGRNF